MKNPIKMPKLNINTHIEKYWNEFKTYITSFGMTLEDLGFNPGASIDQINLIEEILEIPLPEDYKYILQQCNGQKKYGDNCYFNWLPGGLRLLSTEEILDEWNDLPYDNNEFYDEYDEDPRVRNIVWHEKRVPIAQNTTSFTCGISYMFLDYIPAPKGRLGQIISLIDECDYVTLSENFEILLKSYLGLIEKDLLKFRISSPTALQVGWRKFISGDLSNLDGFEIYSPVLDSLEPERLLYLIRKYLRKDDSFIS